MLLLSVRRERIRGFLRGEIFCPIEIPGFSVGHNKNLLWNICQKYSKVVEIYTPVKKWSFSKL